MKVLHILASPHLGGAERVCLHLARAQVAAGAEAKVLLLAEGTVKQTAEQEAIPFVVSPTDFSLPRRARWQQAAANIAEAVREFQPEIVHSHVPLTHLLCHRTLPAMNVPWVCTIHGSWRQFGYSPEAEKSFVKRIWLLARHAAGDRLATRSAGRVIAVSDYTRAQLRQVTVPAKKIRVIINGLPFSPPMVSRAEARRQLNVPESAKIIGAMGHFSRVKGFDLLIEAFARIANQFPNALLLIAGGDVLGNSALRSNLQHRINKLGLSDRAKLVGSVDIRQGFLNALDIFALPSRTEGLPAALVEAMQHGLPCVISSAGGSQEAARPGEESLLFSSGDMQDLAAKLKQLLEASALRERLGAAARERARTQLSIERCAAEYLQNYEEVIATHKI